MQDEIESYLNCPRTNPDRLSFKKFIKYVNGKKKALRTMREKRFVYMVDMLTERLFGNLRERVNDTTKKASAFFKRYVIPLPRIKFTYAELMDVLPKT